MDDIVVIGAGMAGIAAARMLRAAGRRVVVYEARDRIGGRIWTTTDATGQVVERGAEFVHGDGVALWPLLHRYGFATTVAPLWDGRRIAAGATPTAVPTPAAQAAIDRVRTIDDELLGYDGPETSYAQWLAAAGVTGLARHLADIRYAHASATTPERASVAAMRDELVAVRRDGGDDHHITRGYGALVAALADGLTIHLQTPIHRVSHDVSGVALQCADGSIVRANRVVVTVPLAILKRGVMTFSPALPPEKTAAIAALDMGSACKMILQFRAPFWDAGAAFFTLPDPAPVWWTIDPARPILVGLFTGPRADALRAAADPREFCMTVLRTVFGAVVDDTLVAATLVDWTAEAWTGGGYSSVPVGALWARAALAHPVGRVHFAGEATAVDGHPASVHGALVSGERAAQEILDADR